MREYFESLFRHYALLAEHNLYPWF